MMKYDAEIKAYAKLNLTLDVVGKRSDSYHELCTIMQTIDLFDEVYADFSSDHVEVMSDIALPERSVAFRAAYEYQRRTHSGGARIFIANHIPEAAGLGGSSADGAGVLRLMQQHYNAMSEEELFTLASELGSDVPFLLHGSLAVCRGRGEIISPLPSMDISCLIVKPKEGISTKELFSALTPPYAPMHSGAAERAILCGDMVSLCKSVSNALSNAAESMLPEIAEIKRRLTDVGALAAEMSGSGSACFGIFENAAKAHAAAEAFCDMPFCRVCKSVEHMV